MKRMLVMLLALILMGCAVCASAEEYVTLAQLREQAKQGWNETYTAMGREVVADVEMGWFPEAEACPLVSVDPYTIDKDDERLDKWRALPHSIIYDDLSDSISIDVTDHSKHQLVPPVSWYGKWLQDNFRYYGGEVPDREAEDCDITYNEFLNLVEADVFEFTGLTLDDFYIDEVWVVSPSYKGIKVNGEYVRGDKLTATGGYHVFAKQLVEGVPVFGSHPAGAKGHIQYGYYMPEYRYFTIQTVENPVNIEADLPLLSFDSFKGKLEELIDAGNLRGVDAMRFGYGTCKDGDKWKLVPVWMVTCGYSKNPKSDKNVLPYTDEDGTVVAPIGYDEYYFNAQTGEMLETYSISATEYGLPMPKVLTWDDVK